MKQPPPLAVGDGGGHERPRAEQRGVGVVEQAARLHDRPGEDGQVQRDERGHHDRAGARRASWGPGGDGGGHAVDAVVADGRLPEAVRAGGAPAARAGQPGWPGRGGGRTPPARPEVGSPTPSAELDPLDDDLRHRPVAAVGRVLAILSTTARDAASATSPKIVCLRLRCGVGPTVMKNCDPLVPGPAFAIASR